VGQLDSLKDFMLIITAAAAAADFHPRIRAALEQAVAAHPDAALRAEFDVGAREHVEVFSAPDIATARSISEDVNRIDGIRAELAPLRSGW
jgi:hypothetical protein